MQELYEILSSATEEQRQNLAELTSSGFGSSPETLCNHVRYLRCGTIGQLLWSTSWKQIVTDVADHVGIDWSKTLNGRAWFDISTSEIECAVVVKLFENLWEQLTLEQRQQILLDLKRDSNDPHLEGFLLSGGAMIAARMSGFGVYLLASTVLGTLTGALGITLPFAVYIGMSQTIALILGPVGWAALAGGVLFSLNQPNWNRLELTVLYLSTLRYSNDVTQPAQMSLLPISYPLS
jgi:uncharacterized protein YaaW (UPF0174 family)